MGEREHPLPLLCLKFRTNFGELEAFLIIGGFTEIDFFIVYGQFYM